MGGGEGADGIGERDGGGGRGLWSRPARWVRPRGGGEGAGGRGGDTLAYPLPPCASLPPAMCCVGGA